MDTFIVHGGNPIKGEITVGGAKNVALKILIASLLTTDEIVIHNVPSLRDVHALIEILQSLGVHVAVSDHTIRVKSEAIKNPTVPLDVGAKLRSSSLVLGPLLVRYGEANVPNPGGCRIGARPIDRHIEGLKSMGAEISYASADGFFHTRAKKLHGATISFEKNTHTGTEAILLAAVLAEGQTVIQNAAEEVEVDDLIHCLSAMGAKIVRKDARTIVVDGVSSLHGVEYSIMPDRNEEVTFAIAAAITHGDIIVANSQPQFIGAFFEAFDKIGGKHEPLDSTHTRYWAPNDLVATGIVTSPYPGFMTDWQAPWAVLMTQATGTSTIHETVFESRFSYVSELRKMGSKIDFNDPKVDKPKEFYNFNWEDRKKDYHQGITITGPTKLHNAVLDVDDIRAGASLLLAAITATGVSYLHSIDRIDRGYEHIETRLNAIGANIRRIREDDL